jgi:biopolymer transport protein ExbD
MQVRNTDRRRVRKVELLMTPMIDVVFLLLVFFLLTFKIVAPEGDFQVRMPRFAPEPVDSPDLPPVPVRLTADGHGDLASIRFGNRSLGTDFRALRTQVRKMISDDPGPGSGDGPEVRLDCDYQLKYEYVMDAITAVSGYIEQRRVTTMVHRVQLAPARQP